MLSLRVCFNLFPFLSTHCFDPLCPLTVLRGPRYSHVKRRFLQSFCSGGCHAGTWRLSMTDSCGPFRGPQCPLSICKNFLSCQLPARTNVNQCVSFSTEIIFFFPSAKRAFQMGLAWPSLCPWGGVGALGTLTLWKEIIAPSPCHIPSWVPGSPACRTVWSRDTHIQDWQSPGASSPELCGSFELG